MEWSVGSMNTTIVRGWTRASLLNKRVGFSCRACTKPSDGALPAAEWKVLYLNQYLNANLDSRKCIVTDRLPPR